MNKKILQSIVNQSLNQSRSVLTVVESWIWVFDVSRELVEDIISGTVGFLVATAQFGIPEMTNP